MKEKSQTSETVTRGAGLLIGVACFALVLITAPPDGLSKAGWLTVGCALLMASWWVTEAIPIPATALAPLALFPLLGIGTIEATASPYANPVIFLFLGGFLIAAALARCGLHRRIALTILRAVGPAPSRLVAGFMVATAFISMWVSNTATVVMMLPTALSIVDVADRELDRTDAATFSRALLLGLAYSANIGGVATLIGTPPNALLAGFMSETYEVSIGFASWMLFGVPLVVVALPLTWLVLVRHCFPVRDLRFRGGADIIANEREALGRMTRTEWIVGSVTALVAASWIFRPLLQTYIPGLSDAGIAIAGALLLFVIPTSVHPWTPALTWKEAESLPWGVLILFGGGLSLAAAIVETGVADWIGSSMERVQALPLALIVLIVTATVVFLTELTSNTATAAAFLPVVASIAAGIGLVPLWLALPAAVAASCAFMMPVATPPNAIVYGSGRLAMKDMVRAGFRVNLMMIVIITLMVWFVGVPLLT